MNLWAVLACHVGAYTCTAAAEDVFSADSMGRVGGEGLASAGCSAGMRSGSDLLR